MENTHTNHDVLALSVATDELRLDLTRELRRIESVRSTARAVLAAGSLIIALVATFQIAIPANKIPPELYGQLFVLALALYVLMIVCCVAALWPARLASPAYPVGADLYAHIKGKSELEARQVLLEAYQDAAVENRAPARRVRFWTTASALLLPVVVVVLLFLSFNVP